MSLRGSVGHLEQFKHFTLLGTKLYFQINAAKKYILLFWPPISLILIFLFICILWGGGGSLGKNLSEMPFPSQIDMVIPWQQLYKGLKRTELLLQSNPHSWPSFLIAVVSQFLGLFPFFFPHLLMVSLVKMVEQVLAKHVQFPQKSVTQVSPSPLTGHLVKDYCSYVHNFKAGFLYSKCLFS